MDEQQIEKMAASLAREAVTRRLVKQGWGLEDLQRMLPTGVQNMLPTDPTAQRAILGGIIGAGGLGATGMLVNSLTAKKKRPLRSLLTGALLGGVGGAALGGLTAPTDPRTAELAAAAEQARADAATNPLSDLASGTLGLAYRTAPGTVSGIAAGTGFSAAAGRLRGGITPGGIQANRGRQLANLLVDLQGRGAFPSSIALPAGVDPGDFAEAVRRNAYNHRGVARNLGQSLQDLGTQPVSIPVRTATGGITHVSITPGQARAIMSAGTPPPGAWGATTRFLSGQQGSPSWAPRGTGNAITRFVGRRAALPFLGGAYGLYRDLQPRPPGPRPPTP